MEQENYEINVDTLVIIPIGIRKSKVYEYGGEFIVKKSTRKIIEDSCLFFGSSYEGRKEGTKSLIGIEMKVPIVIEDSRCIIFFPTSSCIRESSIWISYQNLVKYTKFNEISTVLYFHQNVTVKVGCKYNLVDNQIIRCIKLEKILLNRKNFIKNECMILEENSC